MHKSEISTNLFWVGAVDWNIRDFHGYSTEKGTTYNSYLMLDEKIALFDTVKKPFAGTLLSNIANVIEPSKVDYIIVNHAEMDHTGALPEIIDACKPQKVFCSPNGRKALIAHFHRDDWPLVEVSTGDTLSLGSRTVSFLETRMLHWPDSMFSYIAEDKILISSDAFGQHWATSERFNDEVDAHELMRHAAKYYANILLPFSPLVQKLIAQVADMKLAIDMIAPDHGLIWRAAPGQIVEAYGKWSDQQPAKKALIIYDTMWQSTQQMGDAIAQGIHSSGVEVKLFDMKASHRSDVMTEAMDAGAIVFGSATLNNGMMPLVADMLTYMKGLAPKNKVGAAFGSFGWSGEAVKLITKELEEMKFNVVDPGLKLKYVPAGEDFAKCVELGKRIAAALTGD